jgi:hypothetical protein
MMNRSPDPDFERAIRFITQTLQQVEALISAEMAGWVRHYLKHDEYEMAFELLFLAIMEQPRPAVVDFVKALNMATEFPFDEDGGIYDYHFFSKLAKYTAE